MILRRTHTQIISVRTIAPRMRCGGITRMIRKSGSSAAQDIEQIEKQRRARSENGSCPPPSISKVTSAQIALATANSNQQCRCEQRQRRRLGDQRGLPRAISEI